MVVSVVMEEPGELEVVEEQVLLEGLPVQQKWDGVVMEEMVEKVEMAVMAVAAPVDPLMESTVLIQR